MYIDFFFFFFNTTSDMENILLANGSFFLHFQISLVLKGRFNSFISGG